MTVNEIYELFAHTILEDVEGKNWKKAVMNTSGDHSYAEIGCIYFDNNDEEHRIKTFRFLEVGVGRAIMKLHKITHESGNSKWNKSLFTLFPDGTFDMEFIWDQEMHDELVELSKE